MRHSRHNIEDHRHSHTQDDCLGKSYFIAASLNLRVWMWSWSGFEMTQFHMHITSTCPLDQYVRFNPLSFRQKSIFKVILQSTNFPVCLGARFRYEKKKHFRNCTHQKTVHQSEINIYAPSISEEEEGHSHSNAGLIEKCSCIQSEFHRVWCTRFIPFGQTGNWKSVIIREGGPVSNGCRELATQWYLHNFAQCPVYMRAIVADATSFPGFSVQHTHQRPPPGTGGTGNGKYLCNTYDDGL